MFSADLAISSLCVPLPHCAVTPSPSSLWGLWLQFFWQPLRLQCHDCLRMMTFDCNRLTSVKTIVKCVYNPIGDPFDWSISVRRQCPQALVVVVSNTQYFCHDGIIILLTIHIAIIHTDCDPMFLLLIRLWRGRLTPLPCTQCRHQLLHGKWVTSRS